jgi:protein gp37
VSDNTKIEWADHTFNPWLGCTKVSPACTNCYAEGWAKKYGKLHLWKGERQRTAVSNWKIPYRWNKGHDEFFAKNGHRQRVFAASLADIFDTEVPQEWREDFWQVVRDTHNLDWMLLTKRPENMADMLPKDWANGYGYGYPNVWLGVTAENQKEADKRIPLLVRTPAAVRFLSMEPLLGPVNLSKWLLTPGWSPTYYDPDNIHGYTNTEPTNEHIQWVIAGGESGSHARPSHPEWFRHIRDQCQAAGVAFHFKQLGEWAPVHELRCNEPGIKGKLWFNWDPDTSVCRIGKEKAGRILDGRTWDEFPKGSEDIEQPTRNH